MEQGRARIQGSFMFYFVFPVLPWLFWLFPGTPVFFEQIERMAEVQLDEKALLLGQLQKIITEK